MANDRRRHGEHGWGEGERGRREGQEYGQGRYGHGYGSEFDERGSEWGRSGSERDWGRREEFGEGREYGRGYDRDQDYGQSGRYGQGHGHQFEERRYGGKFGRPAGMRGQHGGMYGQPEGGRGFEQAYGLGREPGRGWMSEGQSHRSWQGQGTFAGRGPRGYTRSDDRIREDVCDRLTDDALVDASNIEVSVSKCEVTLAGTIDSREAKRRAEDCAESVSGVRNVQNNLRVQPPEMEASDASGRAQAGTRASGSEGKRTT